MNRVWQALAGFGRFWYGFVIGEDPLVAVAVGILVGGTFGLRFLGIPAFWYGPAVVLATAVVTVRRALRRRVRRLTG